jgi:NDP-sugar pyrophosphorylase family protein
MKVIIPMAGIGSRFIAAGYKDPKPLIKVNGKMIIEYIVDIFDEKDEIVFICNEKHLKETKIESVLKNISPNSKIVSMPMHKLGPVYTVQQVFNHIKDDEEVIVSYCDNPYVWNRQDFNAYVHANDLDGCVLSHIGFHPHTLNNTKMAFMKAEDGVVTEIKEKECYTGDPMNEHASTGTYYFKRGSDVKKYFNLTTEKNINHNGEYYVTLVYNLLIQDGLKVGYYDTPFATVMGTPEEVENFEAWANILTKGQIKTEKDLLNCYNYWSDYHQQ